MRIIFVFFATLLVCTISCNQKKQSSKKIDDFITEDIVQTSNTETVATKSLKSTVMVIMEDVNHQELAYGSGVIIDDNKIITNRHVIENAYFGKVKKYGSETVYSIKQVLAIDNSNDLAILEVSNLQKDVDIKFDTTRPNIGKKVYAVGNPKGLEGTFSEGIVSGIRIFKDSSELIQISAPISPGSSGGQIIDEKNQIIGIAVGGIIEGQNLNFAIPSKKIIALLQGFQTAFNLEDVKANRKGNAKITATIKEKVIVKNIIWYKDGGFDPDGYIKVNPMVSYSIYNQLDNSISKVRVLFILYDNANTPVDYSYQIIYQHIPSHLATKIFNLPSSSLSNPYSANDDMGSAEVQLDKKRGYKCVVRVLDFTIDKE